MADFWALGDRCESEEPQTPEPVARQLDSPTKTLKQESPPSQEHLPEVASAAATPLPSLPRVLQFPSVTLKPVDDADLEATMLTVPKSKVAKHLDDFGYMYNDAGQLVQIHNQKPFVWMGQKHYDAVGEAIVNNLYMKMEIRYKLQRLQVPIDAKPTEPTCPIFVSPGFEQMETVMFLSQGSGAVRPGMWARALCINDTLEVGSIFRYIEDALTRGWGIIVINPNENVGLVGDAQFPEPAPAEGSPGDEATQHWLGTSDAQWKRYCTLRNQKVTPIRSSHNPMIHAHYVFNTLLTRGAPNVKNIVIVAHSFGGRCTTHICRYETEDVTKRVRAIAFTDAINDLDSTDPKKVKEIMKTRCINWVASPAKLDTKERDGPLRCFEFSAGHTKHEYTSAACRASVFKWFDQVLTTGSLEWAPPKSGKASPRVE